MKNLDIENFKALVRTGGVYRVFLMQYPQVDGGGWYLDCDHRDQGLTREFKSKRGELRVFKTSDAAFKLLTECAYFDAISVVLRKDKE